MLIYYQPPIGLNILTAMSKTLKIIQELTELTDGLFLWLVDFSEARVIEEFRKSCSMYLFNRLAQLLIFIFY